MQSYQNISKSIFLPPPFGQLPTYTAATYKRNRIKNNKTQQIIAFFLGNKKICISLHRF